MKRNAIKTTDTSSQSSSKSWDLSLLVIYESAQLTRNLVRDLDYHQLPLHNRQASCHLIRRHLQHLVNTHLVSASPASANSSPAPPRPLFQPTPTALVQSPLVLPSLELSLFAQPPLLLLPQSSRQAPATRQSLSLALPLLVSSRSLLTSCKRHHILSPIR